MKTLASLLLVCVVAFSGCKSFGKGKRNKDTRTAAEKKQELEATANPDVDMQAFLGRLRKAVAARDMNTLASMMTADFAYVMGDGPDSDRKGEGVFQFWDENGLWPELEGILSEKFVAKGEFYVAPPQFANPAVEYEGYRAGLRRVNGSWKFAYFVNG
ncbi:MAG: hypothetical protein AVDCRST_MAG42-2959 [uncultured Chthoniobacterales bacterium]|uniref:SnoaL-like domain-containing protein n=1 Tax=uncultured Chthoniobacterales bacterium TaxID=1836801 RepID=A0A6J4IXA6_9BACT|nr:MAG: hypothetical protein AVDCRST_MAG42-2959 [uncultured Chthoniobacterales bacterium]